MYFKSWIRLPGAFFNPCSTIKSSALSSCFCLCSSEHSRGLGNVHRPRQGSEEQKGDQETESPGSHFTSPKGLFHGQSEALTPNPSIVKAIYISRYSHTFGMTEQPTAPSRGVQSPSVITRVSLHLSFNFPLAGRLITGICAGLRDRSHTVLCQAGTGKLARHHLVLNETL